MASLRGRDVLVFWHQLPLPASPENCLIFIILTLTSVRGPGLSYSGTKDQRWKDTHTASEASGLCSLFFVATQDLGTLKVSW